MSAGTNSQWKEDIYSGKQRLSVDATSSICWRTSQVLFTYKEELLLEDISGVWAHSGNHQCSLLPCPYEKIISWCSSLNILINTACIFWGQSLPTFILKYRINIKVKYSRYDHQLWKDSSFQENYPILIIIFVPKSMFRALIGHHWTGGKFIYYFRWFFLSLFFFSTKSWAGHNVERWSYKTVH